MLKIKQFIILTTFAFLPVSAMCDSTMVIHDAHIHYDEDVWQALPAADAINFLKQQNIQRALVSATPTEGAEKLYRADPDLVIPMLRPYRDVRHRYLWFNDAELKSYLLMHLGKAPYRGFGEFHVFGNDANSVPVEEMIALARERSLALHAHTDLEGMRIILKKSSDINVIWAHAGFDVALPVLREMLESYPQFYIELSFREGMLDKDDQLTPEWKNLLIQMEQRVLRLIN